MLQVGQSVVSESDLDRALGSVVEAAHQLTGARCAALAIVAPDGRGLEHLATAGMSPVERDGIREHPGSRHGHRSATADPSRSLGLPVVVRGEPCGDLCLADKTSGVFTDTDKETILVLADWAAAAVERARLAETGENRRVELDRALHALAATTEIARTVAGETRVERVLELIARRGRALVHARGVVILLPSNDHLVVTAVAGAFDRDLLGERVPVAGSATGLVHSSGQAERLSDAPSRMRFALAERLGAATGLLVPMIFHGRRIGVFAAFDRTREGLEFSDEDQNLIEAFAASAATALASAQTVAAQSLRRSIEASEQERTRWARELHDATLQELAALRVGLAASRLKDSSDNHTGAVDAAITQIDDTILGLRSLITDLRPPSLDTAGAIAAIEALAERMQTRSDVSVSLRTDTPSQAGGADHRRRPALEIALYRITQELLTNAIRHARATHVAITIMEEGPTITLTVSDDGVGFDLAAERDGFGLIGVNERVALLSGRLDVSSTLSRGTTVRAELPIPAGLASP